MGIYKTKYNPFSKSLQWILSGTLITFKEGVDTYNDLPVTSNSQNNARIVSDTGHLYVWSIEESSGELSDWVDQGDIIDIQWDSIEGKPSSTPTNIDDAVSKKHTQNTDTKLDEGGANEVVVADIKDAVDNKHSHSNKTTLDNTEESFTTVLKNTLLDVVEDSVRNADNIAILAFKLAYQASLTIFNMVSMIVDEYEDESGIDTVNSVNEYYNADGNYYANFAGQLSVSPFAHFKCNDNASNTVVTDNGTGLNNGICQTNTNNVSSTGKINNAFDFDGSNNYFTMTDLWNDIKTNTTGSISIWVKIDAHVHSQGIFCFGDTNANEYFRLHYHDSQSFRLEITDAGSDKWLGHYDIVLDDGSWHHIVVIQDGTAPKLYIDKDEKTIIWDIENDKTVWFNSLDGIDNGYVGAKFDNGVLSYYLDGKVDDVRYYQNYTLTTIDIDALYNDGAGTEEDKPAVTPDNMTLISESFSAESEPNSARIVALEEDVNPITLNTHLKCYISKDDGDTWAEVILSDEGDFDNNKRILVGNADLSLSGIGSGTDMVYEFITHDNKALKLHAVALSWD